MMQNMDGDKLDFEKYRERLESLFPDYSESELREYFRLRVEFWKIVLINY